MGEAAQEKAIRMLSAAASQTTEAPDSYRLAITLHQPRQNRSPPRTGSGE